VSLSPELIQRMVKEAARLGDSDLHHYDQQVQDVVCHVHVLAAEVERLQAIIDTMDRKPKCGFPGCKECEG
jgi:hypothetical protein